MTNDEIIKNLADVNVIYPTGKMNPNTRQILTKYPELVAIIRVNTQFVIGDNILERIYCIRNGISTVPHCLTCDAQLKFTVLKGKQCYATYCSITCRNKCTRLQQTARDTMMEKYGVHYTAQSEQLKTKMFETNQQRYGSNSVFGNEDFQAKSKRSILAKYGVTNAIFNAEVRLKHKQACADKFSNIDDYQSYLAKRKASNHTRHIVSKAENQWLDQLNIPQEMRQIPIRIEGSLIIADAYNANTNTVYEFWGSYFHGDPNVHNLDDMNEKVGKSFRELYTKTLEKRQLILGAGYNLIEQWESDWKITKLSPT